MVYSSSINTEKLHQKVPLVVPKQAKAPEGSFLISAKEIKRWVNQLPVANIGETARQVYSTLANFNRIQIPTLVRAEIIELFREPVRYINTNITKHYFNVGFPLSKKASKAALLAGELCNELSISYKIIFLEQTLGDAAHFNKKLIIIAAQRALQYMKQQMFHHWLTYREYKPGAWQEVNYLYSWAYQNQVHQVGVKEDNKFAWRKKSVQSIEEVYMNMVIMATTNPYSLNQPHLRQLHNKLPEWVKLAEIKPIFEVDYNAGIFYLNLWGDTPPLKNLSPAHRKDRRFMAIDLNGIIAEARIEFENSYWEMPLGRKKNPELLSRTLLKQLIQTWNKSLERKHARTKIHHELEALVGGSTLLNLLEKKRDENPLAAPPPVVKTAPQPTSQLTWSDSVFSSLSISPISGGTNAGGDSLFVDSMSVTTSLLGGGLAPDSLSPTAPGAQPTPPPARETLFALLTYNESMGGYCFEWKEDQVVKIRVGDVLGIRSQTNKDEFGFAVCRWLKSTADNKLYIGVQLLAPSCSAVTVTPFRATSTHKKEFACLLLSGGSLENNQQTLISIQQPFELDSVMNMVTEFGKHRIKITRQLEATHNFIHYQFSYVDDDEDTPIHAQTSSELITDDLKDIWDEL